MQVLHLECAAGEKDILIAELYARGTSGILEEEASGERVALQAFFGAAFPADEFSAYSPRWEPADETNWVRIIMESWDPIPVGERFFLAPDWRDDPTPEGRIRLEVRPGLALGTGYHATTQMCLEAMERRLAPGDRLLDLGTGSGILSKPPGCSGEREIIAADIDPQAIESATENLARADVPVKLITGSTSVLPNNCADFLVAGISAPAGMVRVDL